MDVPETGAVFAFGRSHLTISGDGHDNNYFFIKKDRVKRLICGQNQSAVICESGRLFVWGENPCGQLAIGTCENTVTKPSCVKHIKKLGHTVKDFQFGSNFSVLLTDASKVFFAGKNIFPFNARIESLDGKLQHDITEIPIELEEFTSINETFEMIRAGDEHFVLLTSKANKVIGWGFNSHHQLAMVDPEKVLHSPDVFFETEDGEAIKFVECGKLSTCIVTEFNDLYIVGKFSHMTISTFTKIREPIVNSTIIQLQVSHDDEIFLVSNSGSVYKSNDFQNIIDLRFDEMSFPKINEKIVAVAPGSNFLTVLTEQGRCYSWLKEESSLVESGKLKYLRAVDVQAGPQHVLVSTMLRNEDVNGNQEQMLNQTYTINFNPIKGLGSGEENYQEPDTGENVRISLEMPADEKDSDDTSRNIGSRATTMECKDTESSGNSSSTPNRSNSTIRFIDNGVEKTLDAAERDRNNSSVRIQIDDENIDEEHKGVQRKKTPMPRGRRSKPSKSSDDDLDENGMIDRDEDELNDDDDDVSTSTLHGSDESLADYIKEENRINDEKSNGAANGKIRKWKQFVSGVKEKGKGLSCRNADNVIGEDDVEPVGNCKDNSKACAIM